MEFDEVAARLDALATYLTSPAARAALTVPAARAFGVGAGGELAALAGALHTQCASATAARERDAVTLAAAATALATSVRAAGDAYRDLPNHHHALGEAYPDQHGVGGAFPDRHGVGGVYPDQHGVGGAFPDRHRGVGDA